VPEPVGGPEEADAANAPAAAASLDAVIAWLSGSRGAIGFALYVCIMLAVFWTPISRVVGCMFRAAAPRAARVGDALESGGPADGELRQLRAEAMGRREAELKAEAKAKSDAAMSKRLAARQDDERRTSGRRPLGADGQRVSSFVGLSMQQELVRSASAAATVADDGASVRREQDARYAANKAKDEKAAADTEGRVRRRSARVAAARARATAAGASHHGTPFELLVRLQGGSGGRLVMRAEPGTRLQEVMDWLELESSTGGGDSASAMQRLVIHRGLPSGMEGWRLCTFRPREQLCSWRDFEDGVGRASGGFAARARRTLAEVGIEGRTTLVLELEGTGAAPG